MVLITVVMKALVKLSVPSLGISMACTESGSNVIANVNSFHDMT